VAPVPKQRGKFGFQCSPKTAMSYREQQRHLFYEIDHKARLPGLPATLPIAQRRQAICHRLYVMTPAARLNELPEAIRKLEPTAVENR